MSLDYSAERSRVLENAIADKECEVCAEYGLAPNIQGSASRLKLAQYACMRLSCERRDVRMTHGQERSGARQTRSGVHACNR